MDADSTCVDLLRVDRRREALRSKPTELVLVMDVKKFAIRVAGAPGIRIVNGTDAAPGQFPFQVRSPDSTQLSVGQSLFRPQRSLTGSQFMYTFRQMWFTHPSLKKGTSNIISSLN
jgi:hypothetical protein